jgi:cell division septum initiation protein DivIVA
MKLIPKQKSKKPEKSPTDRDSRACATQAAEKKLSALMKNEPAVRKIIRKAAVLADLITEEDIEDDARVIREATKATLHIFDKDANVMREFPDHKTRLAAATLRRAYHEGLPVKRSVTLTGDFQSAEQLIERLQTSPEALKAIMGSGIQVAVDGEVIDGEFTVIQKTGSENEGVASRESGSEK